MVLCSKLGAVFGIAHVRMRAPPRRQRARGRRHRIEVGHVTIEDRTAPPRVLDDLASELGLKASRGRVRRPEAGDAALLVLGELSHEQFGVEAGRRGPRPRR